MFSLHYKFFSHQPIKPKLVLLMIGLLLLCNFFSAYMQFISSLKDNLNAEVALGTVTNVKEACAWLGYTYLFIRMRLNPLAYGIGWDEVWWLFLYIYSRLFIYH